MFDMIESAGFAGFMPVVELRDSKTESVPA